MDWLIEPWRMGFMQTALAASLCVSLSCSMLGVYVVQRRMAFIGDAIAHTTLPGLVLSNMFGLPLSLGAAIAAIVTALGIAWVSKRQQIREDTAIGVVFTAMFALGILLMSRSRSFRDLSHILFGNLLGVEWSDILWMSAATGVILCVLLLLHKELELTSFDRIHAEMIGIRSDRLRTVLLILLAIAIVTGIQGVGVLLTTALLITPAATAAFLTERFALRMVISCAVGCTSALVGLTVSYFADMATGASIVLVNATFFLAAWMISSLRKRWSA